MLLEGWSCGRELVLEVSSHAIANAFGDIGAQKPNPHAANSALH